MNLLSRIFGSPTTYHLRLTALAPVFQEMHPRELYKLLDGYYLNNGLYDNLAEALYEASVWKEALKGLRNPAYRVVEFYVAHLWPGTLPEALPIKTDNDRIVEPIQQIWRWSNWTARKQVAARQVAKYGDLFIKAVSTGEQVYLQLIEPGYVTDFETDHRDFVTYIQVDIPQERRNADGEIEGYTHTEVWDKEAGTYRRWEHEEGIGAALTKLGPSQETKSLAEFGIDFVPFVQAKFKDIGEDRGAGAFTLALDKIDEVNRKATRLGQILFRYNKPLMALRANAMDPTGRPLPPPRVGGDSGSGIDGDTIELGDDRLLRLPGTSEVQFLVPNINYQALLDALQADLEELEEDLPEIAYYRLQNKTGDPSGRALQLLLAPAIDRVVEARGNVEAALARAQAMALTMAKAARLPGFTDIGDYGAGDFSHSFDRRDVLPLSELEQAEESKTYVEMGVPLKTVLRRQGWSKTDLQEMDQDRDEEQGRQQETLAAAVLKAQRAMDSGAASDGLEQA